MKILNTEKIKKELTENIIKSKRDDKLILLTSNPTEEANFYKNVIIKRCNEFHIDVVDKEFNSDINNNEIMDYLSNFNINDGYIILMPFRYKDDINYLKDNINLNDLDAFTYKSMGKVVNGDFNYLPATSNAIIRFLDTIIDYKGKNVVIANRTTVIGLPLANFLVNKSATVTILNSSSKNTKEIIKSCDVFISAIGVPNFYGKDYFKDGQILIDVGTSYKDGKIVGDIDYESLSDLNVDILTNKKGIGQITTLCLLHKLMR